MGWFASASTGSPQKSSDGGSIAPSRSSREQCYIARDLFFDCLDEKGIVDATKEDGAARSNCRKQLQEFENACSGTWVKYFKEKRVMEHKRSLSIEKIKKEDAKMAAEGKLEKQKSGRLWGWRITARHIGWKWPDKCPCRLHGPLRKPISHLILPLYLIFRWWCCSVLGNFTCRNVWPAAGEIPPCFRSKTTRFIMWNFDFMLFLISERYICWLDVGYPCLKPFMPKFAMTPNPSLAFIRLWLSISWEIREERKTEHNDRSRRPTFPT